MIAGRYTLEAEIGRGGMGAVWRGRDEVLGRTVALKKIGVAPGGITPDALRAEREAKLAAKLNHANVVAVFDLVEEAVDGQSQQWLVMEYVEGTDLAELIRERGRLSPDEAAPILAQIASALAAAHGAGIVHRDVKPSNILVAPDGQVKLSDFGIARTSADPALTQTGLVTGSPAYLSPEVASGQQATPASDVWSWGATLFHALEGRPPYQVGDNLLGALYRIVHEEPPRCDAAGWLAPALEATMTREPAERWPIATAQEFLEAGPDTQPVVASVGGLAAIGLADADVTGRAGPGPTTTRAPPRCCRSPPRPHRRRPRRGPGRRGDRGPGRRATPALAAHPRRRAGPRGRDGGRLRDRAATAAGRRRERVAVRSEHRRSRHLVVRRAPPTSRPRRGWSTSSRPTSRPRPATRQRPSTCSRRRSRSRAAASRATRSFWGDVRSAKVLDVSGGPGDARGALHLPLHEAPRRAHRGRRGPEADLRGRHLPHRPGAVTARFHP